MSLKKFRYIEITIPLLVILVLIELVSFAVNNIEMVSDTSKRNFTYTLKIRDAVEEIDKTVERAELNINVLTDVIKFGYDTNKINNASYNRNVLKDIDSLIKAALINTPGVDGAWFQINANASFAYNTYSWYEYSNNKLVNVRASLQKENAQSRKLTQESDPYYFEAIKAKKLIWSEIYTDADVNRKMVTIAKPVVKNGVLIGVVGIDISIKDLQARMKDMQAVLVGSEIFLIDENKNIILEQLFEYRKNKKTDYSFLELLADNNSEQMMEYSDNDKNKTAMLIGLSNKYHIILTFPSVDVFKGFEKLFKTVYLILLILGILTLIILINRYKMAKLNKELETEILKQKTIIKSAPTIMVIKDLEGRYLDCNDKFLELLGKTKKEVIGKTVKDLFSETMAAAINEKERIVKESKKRLVNELWLADKNGEELLLEIYTIPLFDKSGRLIGLLIDAIDLTKARKEQELLQKAKEAAEVATAMKSNFLANMSHEIRTPLNGVLGFLQLLEDTDLSNLQKEFITDAQKSSEILLMVINEILDFSKIEAGKLNLDNISFDIRAAVEDVAVMSTSGAFTKGLEVNSLICTDVPNQVFGDPGRIKQILNNLVGNAIKFTQSGEIMIYVNMEAETDNEAIISFRVKDTGIGIAEDKLSTIFESFTQADASTTRKFGGTGLGLAISQKLVEIMNGKIIVESKEGEGSEFTFIIPLSKDKNSDEDSKYSARDLDKANILIVDNNPTDLVIIGYYLAELNCTITEASSAEEALAILNEENNGISAVLIDENIQNSDEIELSSLIKHGEYTKNIPLILYSSITKRIEPSQAREKGFAGHLTKPIKKNELIETINNVVNKKDYKIPEELITKQVIKDSQFDPNAKVLVVEDSEINCKLIIKILNKAGLNCDLSVDGQKALELFKTKNYDLVLMDCEMPIMDGHTTTKEIRKFEGTAKHTPIIAMTANVLNADREKCYESGMDDYISKPLDINKLLLKISKYIKVENKTDKLEEKISKREHDIGFIINEIVAAFGFTKEEATNLLAQFMVEMQKTIKELESLIENNDVENLKKIAHKLKGSSANLRVQKITELSEKLEKEIAKEDKDSCIKTVDEMKNYMLELNKPELPKEDYYII